jgi:hypothetical protein
MEKSTARIIKANGLNPALYQVLDELDNTLIVKHRITGDVKVLDK